MVNLILSGFVLLTWALSDSMAGKWQTRVGPPLGNCFRFLRDFDSLSFSHMCLYGVYILSMKQLRANSLRSFNRWRMLESLKEKEWWEFKNSVPHRSLFCVVPNFEAASYLQKAQGYKLIRCIVESEKLTRGCAEQIWNFLVNYTEGKQTSLETLEAVAGMIEVMVQGNAHSRADWIERHRTRTTKTSNVKTEDL